jgi:hypothetical protein
MPYGSKEIAASFAFGELLAMTALDLFQQALNGGPPSTGSLND